MYNMGNMATPGRRNTHAVSNKKPQLHVPYPFTDPEEFTFSTTDLQKISWVSLLKTADTPGVDSFSGCMNPQRVKVKVLMRKKTFRAIQGKRYFFQKVAIPRSFLKTTASILQVLVRVTPPSDPGLKTSKKRSRNPKRWKRNIRKPRQKESIIPRRWEKSNPQERKVLLAAALENVLNK